MTDNLRPEANEPELDEATKSEEPNAEETVSETASEGTLHAELQDGTEGEEGEAEPRPAPKLERLQKILAQAGIASRRSAEGMITEGRVQVNGKVVSELGTKADAARDHIRVDGKLLHGAERLRYYMLNKPKGFVTTVKDPEGRATVMKFFERMPERLYPVGRLDYMSEGLLLVTNDGELANRLTKAASGVEKTYLVKVSGQPTGAELDILRGGVTIERGKPGEGRVRTAPARVRQVRQGDNPWYEVVLIEGRNRELRKMFEGIGHFVEKIRRVGYGPLVLDVEPGKLRELAPEELTALRQTAEGKHRTPKAKDVRRRNALDAQLPTLAPRPTRPRPVKPISDQSSASGAAGGYRPNEPFGARKPLREERPLRPARPPEGGFRPAASRGGYRGPARPDDRPRHTGPSSFGPGRSVDRPPSRPAWKQDDRGPRQSARPAARPDWKRSDGAGGKFGPKPAWGKPASGDRQAFQRPTPPRRDAPAAPGGFVAKRPARLQIDAVEPDRPGSQRATPVRPHSDRQLVNRPRFDRAASDGPRFDRPKFDRPRTDRPKLDQSRPDRLKSDRPRPDRPERASTGRPSGPARGPGAHGAKRPPRSGGFARPFTTSTGKPRAGGARPSSKPGKPAGRSYGSKPGGSGKTGYIRKSAGSGARRTGPRPGGKRPGGAPKGKKRG